jgi:hypothetical protein
MEMNTEIQRRLKHALEHAEKRGSALESHVAVLKSDVRALIAAQETGVTSTQARITAAIMEGVTQETSEEVLTALSRAAGRVRAALAASTASDKQEADCHQTCSACWGEQGERWPCAKKAAAPPAQSAEQDRIDAKSLLDSHVELNMSNYHDADVDHLNDWAVRAYEFIAKGASK